MTAHASSSPTRRAPLAGARAVASMVKLSHTVFAAPFAVAAALLATRRPHVPFTVARALAIATALVAARTAAMAYNRLVDRDVDAKNPRTKDREIPRGIVSLARARTLVILASLAFVAAAAFLGAAPLVLSPLVLLVLLGYSHAKRFTWASHLWLGVALALAPGGAWIAAGARPELGVIALMLAVACWVCGFDILYSLQDERFDRAEGLASVPARFGARRSLWMSRGFHLACVVSLAAAGALLGGHLAFFAGVALVAALLVYEQSLLRPKADRDEVSLENLDKAFFDINGWVSLGFCALVALDVFVLS